MRLNILLTILIVAMLLPVQVGAFPAGQSTCSDMGVPNEPDSMTIFLQGGTTIYALEPPDGSWKVALNHSSWAEPYQLTTSGVLLPSDGNYSVWAVEWGAISGGGDTWGGGGGGGGSFDPLPAPVDGGGGTWGDGGGGGGYWGAGIRVCQPTSPSPTPTRTATPPPPTATRVPVPAGCSVRDLPNGATTSFSFSSPARIYSWNGTTEYWDQYGGYSDSWITLPQYGSTTKVEILANRYETFRPADATPGADLLVCPTNAPTSTPGTATATPAGTWPPTSCTTLYSQSLRSSQWGGYYHTLVFPSSWPVSDGIGGNDFYGANVLLNADLYGYRLRISPSASIYLSGNVYPTGYIGGDREYIVSGHTTWLWGNDHPYDNSRPFSVELCPPSAPPPPRTFGECQTFDAQMEGGTVYGNAYYIVWPENWNVAKQRPTGGEEYTANTVLLGDYNQWTFLFEGTGTIDGASSQDIGNGWKRISGSTTYLIANDHPILGDNDFQFTLCPPSAATATPAAPTRTPPATWTVGPTNTPANTRTPTSSPTLTNTPGIGASCVGREYNVPMTPSTIDIYLRQNQRLFVADSRVNVTSATWQGQLGMNEYRWGGDAGTYAFSGQTGPARVLLCDADILTTPTSTLAATSTAAPGTTAAPGASPTTCNICGALGTVIANQRTQIAIMERTATASSPTATGTPTSTATATGTSTATATNTATETPTSTPTSTATATPTATPDIVYVRLDIAKSGKVRENAGFVAINLSLSKPSQRALTVSWETQSGSAIGGLDYVPSAETVTFAAGETVKTVQVEILDDDVGESDETFTIVLKDPINVALDPFPVAMIEILDDDLPPTSTSLPTPTGTLTATPTTAGLPPATYACAPSATLPPENRSPMPDLALVLPTVRPLPSLVATIAISAHVMIDVVQTVQLAIETPMAAINTSTAKYSWAGGQQISETAVANMEPGMQWVVLMNPSSAAWTTEGGALWAIQPFVGPLMLPISIALLVVIAQLFLWLLKWLLKLVDIVIKLLELIPGE